MRNQKCRWEKSLRFFVRSFLLLLTFSLLLCGTALAKTSKKESEKVKNGSGGKADFSNFSSGSSEMFNGTASWEGHWAVADGKYTSDLYIVGDVYTWAELTVTFRNKYTFYGSPVPVDGQTLRFTVDGFDGLLYLNPNDFTLSLYDCSSSVSSVKKTLKHFDNQLVYQYMGPADEIPAYNANSATGSGRDVVIKEDEGASNIYDEDPYEGANPWLPEGERERERAGAMDNQPDPYAREAVKTEEPPPLAQGGATYLENQPDPYAREAVKTEEPPLPVQNGQPGLITPDQPQDPYAREAIKPDESLVGREGPNPQGNIPLPGQDPAGNAGADLRGQPMVVPNPDGTYTWQIGSRSLTTRINVMDYIDGDVWRINEMAAALGWMPENYLGDLHGGGVNNAENWRDGRINPAAMSFTRDNMVLQNDRGLRNRENSFFVGVPGQGNLFIAKSEKQSGEAVYRRNGLDDEWSSWTLDGIVMMAYAMENATSGTDPFAGLLTQDSQEFYRNE